MLLDIVVVVIGGLLPDVGLGVGVEPQPHPLCHRVLADPGDVDMLVFLDGLLQLFFALLLGLGQDVFRDSLARLQVPASRVSPLPSPVLPLADAALAVGSALCHGQSSP